MCVEATKSWGKAEQGKWDQELQGGGTILSGVVRASLAEKAAFSHKFCDPSFPTISCHYVITQIKNCFSGIMKKLRLLIPF